jgi:hypothetical protein
MRSEAAVRIGVGKSSSHHVSQNEIASDKPCSQHLSEAQRKRLDASVNGPVYTDPRGNPYDVDGVRGEVDKAIERVAKLNDSTQHQR